MQTFVGSAEVISVDVVMMVVAFGTLVGVAIMESGRIDVRQNNGADVRFMYVEP